MCHSVHLETIFARKTFPAVLALERLFSAVRQQMALETTKTSKQLATLVALVTLGPACHNEPEKPSKKIPHANISIKLN